MNIKVPDSVNHFFGKAIGLSKQEVKKLYSPYFLTQAVKLGDEDRKLGFRNYCSGTVNQMLLGILS